MPVRHVGNTVLAVECCRNCRRPVEMCLGGLKCDRDNTYLGFPVLEWHEVSPLQVNAAEHILRQQAETKL